MLEFPIYSAGTFITTDNSFEVINPWTGKPFARSYKAGRDHLENAIRSALTVKKQLANMPVYQRNKVLLDIAAGLEKGKPELAELLSRESAKPLKYAIGEIERSIQTFIIAAEETKRLPGEFMSIDWTSAGKGKEAWIKHFPVGLVAGISPFNFPMNLAVHKIAPALAAGCPIILKPSTSTPLSTLSLAKIIDSTDLPKGTVSILPMERSTGQLLVTDPRISLLSFTGSPEVGWKMKQQAGKKSVLLELGGNAGVIVTETANLDLAIQKCLVGGFAYSGQVCIHAQRFYVQESIFKSFCEKFLPLVEKLKMGDPLSMETDISSMIDVANAKRVESWVTEARNAGASLLTGGKRKGNVYSPTVLSGTNPAMKVCSNELFGPVVTVESYEKFPEAIEAVNDSKFGLQAGVFTNRLDELNDAFNKLQVGGVIINDVPTFRVDHMPYGGTKDSGIGREGVKYAIRKMMEPRILVKDKD